MFFKVKDPVAVIDIGSNSIRLVVYDGLNRSPAPIFNEKVLSGLALNLQETGTLNKASVKSALSAISRFVALSRLMDVSGLFVFATAAVRDASDGGDFVHKIEKEHDVKVRVLTGQEEAEFAAKGVISSIYKPHGVVGDLGGGSLELGKIGDDHQQLSELISLPIGPLRFAGKDTEFHSDYKRAIDRHLKKFPFEETLKGNNFYAVGGAFRSLAKLHMGRRAYPLKVIHNYSCDADEFDMTLQLISRMTETSLAKMANVSRKRIHYLPFAAHMLSRIIQYGRPKKVVFSTFGVREGLLYDQLQTEVQMRDPLISGCHDMMARVSRMGQYGQALFEWTRPVFKHKEFKLAPKDERLHLAACLLSEISCYENTEYRAELAYRRILDSSLLGLTHKERLFVAKALYHRYRGSADEEALFTMQTILGQRQFQDAHILGGLMRLARSVSGSHPDILKTTSLQLNARKITLSFDEDSEVLKGGECVGKRLKKLATLMGREEAII